MTLTELARLTTHVTYTHQGEVMWMVENSPHVPRIGETVERGSNIYTVNSVLWRQSDRLTAKVNLI